MGADVEVVVGDSFFVVFLLSLMKHNLVNFA